MDDPTDAHNARCLSVAQFPGHRPASFEYNENVPRGTQDEQCLAARRLAVVFANAGEGGFQQIAGIVGIRNQDTIFMSSGRQVDDEAMWETIYRLFLVANLAHVPREACKAASHCGGIWPYGPIKPGAALVLNPGNHAYACLCGHLKTVYEETVANDRDFTLPSDLIPGKDRFMGTSNATSLGDFVEAALGAADAAQCVLEYMRGELPHWKRSYSEIMGAGRGEGDRVTPWIDKWLLDWRLNGGCGCPQCISEYGSGSPPNATAVQRVIRPMNHAGASASSAGGVIRPIVETEPAAQVAQAGIAAVSPAPIHDEPGSPAKRTRLTRWVPRMSRVPGVDEILQCSRGGDR